MGSFSYPSCLIYPQKRNSYHLSLSLWARLTAISCHNDYLNQASGGKTYAYRFSVPPALHGQDVPYTFYNGPNSTAIPGLGIPNQSIAEALQKYIVTFTATGVPSSENLPVFPQWGTDKNLLDLNVTGINVVKDDTANNRCAWWQKALYS